MQSGRRIFSIGSRSLLPISSFLSLYVDVWRGSLMSTYTPQQSKAQLRVPLPESWHLVEGTEVAHLMRRLCFVFQYGCISGVALADTQQHYSQDAAATAAYVAGIYALELNTTYTTYLMTVGYDTAHSARTYFTFQRTPHSLIQTI